MSIGIVVWGVYCLIGIVIGCVRVAGIVRHASKEKLNSLAVSYSLMIYNDPDMRISVIKMFFMQIVESMVIWPVILIGRCFKT